MVKKKRQHYVWQRYLRNWAKNQSQIYCLLDNKVILAKTTRLAVEKNFYKLGKFNLKDLEYVEKIYVQTIEGAARDYAYSIINKFRTMAILRDFILAVSPNSAGVANSLDVSFTNFEENYHAKIEGDAVYYLDSLLNRQTEFYNAPDENTEFNLFLMTQYVRTKKIQEAMLSLAAKRPNLYKPTERTMSVYRLIVAHTVAMGLSDCCSKQMCSFKLLINDTDAPFITGDQPVINTKGGDIDPDTGYVPSLELYYPISPKIAILIDPKYGTNQNQESYVTEEEAKQYNDMIFHESHEQIFAYEVEHLQPYIGYSRDKR